MGKSWRFDHTWSRRITVLTVQVTGLPKLSLGTVTVPRTDPVFAVCCHRDPSETLPWNKELGKTHNGSTETSWRHLWMDFTLAAVPSLCCGLEFCHGPSTEFIHLCHSTSAIPCSQLMVCFGRFLRRSTLKEDLLCFRNVLVLSGFRHHPVATPDTLGGTPVSS